MVGLNHEFAIEFLWREYPTDLRNNQYWDVRSYLDPTESDSGKLREKLRNISLLHYWKTLLKPQLLCWAMTIVKRTRITNILLDKFNNRVNLILARIKMMHLLVQMPMTLKLSTTICN
jgi:hypothetical protein